MKKFKIANDKNITNDKMKQKYDGMGSVEVKN